MKEPFFILMFFILFLPFSLAESNRTCLADKLEVYTVEELAPDYECTYSVTFSGSIDIGNYVTLDLEVECEGTGTSNESGQEACERAAEVVAACVQVWNTFF